MEKGRFLDLAKKRISVRRYTDIEVSREDIDICLEAARIAPSACNSQPWKFVVVDDKRLKNELCEKAFAGLYKMNSFAKAAPVIVAVVSEKAAFFSKVGGQFRGTQYCLMDVGMACEHFALQASELGLGTCLIGWFNERAVKRLLGIPGRKKIDLLISLGHYENIVREKKRKPLNEISAYNKY
jgi:nitroreductase